MSTVTELSDTLQDQVLSTLHSAQGIALDAIRSISDAVEPVLPKDLPFADQLPKAEEVLDAGFKLVQKVIESQHQFVKNILESVPAAKSSAPAGKNGAKASAGT
jgi:hypothetical protein